MEDESSFWKVDELNNFPLRQEQMNDDGKICKKCVWNMKGYCSIWRFPIFNQNKGCEKHFMAKNHKKEKSNGREKTG